MLAIWSLALWVNGFQNYYTYKLKNRFLGPTLGDSYSVFLEGVQASVAPSGDVRRGSHEARSENQNCHGLCLFSQFPSAQATLTGGTCSPSTCYDNSKMDVDFLKLLFEHSSF